MKKIIILLIICYLSINEKALCQNDVQISHYMFNELSFNPAFAGKTKNINLSILGRKQWSGFNDAPTTQILNIDLFKDKIGGFGLSVSNDKLGFENSLNFKLSYAYHKQLSKNATISAGIGLGILNKSIDGSELTYANEDPNKLDPEMNEFKPNIDIGILFSYQKLIIGLSSTHITKSTDNATYFEIPRHYYMYANYTIEANENLDIIPSVYIQSSSFSNNTEANIRFAYNKKYWAGLSYRLDDATVVLLGLKIYKNLNLGYSYDLNSSAVKAHSSGSHEIMLSYSLSKGSKYYKSPRLFN